jgi:hypothetical protein
VILGTDPLDSDTDGDGAFDTVEALRAGTDPLVADTDADGCDDGREIASPNGDRAVNVIDLMIIAQRVNTEFYHRSYDADRNKVIDVRDLLSVAIQNGVCPQPSGG